MFCPDGFVTLYEVNEYLVDHATFNLKGSLEKSFIDLQEANSISPTGFKIDTGIEADESEAYGKWLLMAFLELYGPELRVVLSSGVLVKVPRWVSQPEWSPFEPEDWQDFNLYVSFPDKREARLVHLRNSLPYINEKSLTLDSEKAEYGAAQVGLRPLHGLPFCISDGLFPIDYQLAELVESKLQSKLLANDATIKDVKGHPLLDRIIELVEREGVSRDQAKARLGRRCKTYEWRSLWKEAARLRPDLRLSVPGPKGRKL